MAVPVDSITHKRLILAKQLFQHAVVQSASQHNTISRILAVIGFDLAVETVLNAMVSALDPSRSAASTFQGLVQQCDCLLPAAGCNPVPDKANIQHVHSIRNDAQHKAKYPNESAVSDCRTYTRDFLRKVVVDLWALDFDCMSLTDIVQNQAVKQFLTDAETALSAANYHQAAEHAAAGLTKALNRVETAIVGRLPSFASGIMLVDSFGGVSDTSDARDAYRALQRVRETLLYVALGLDYGNYMRYRQIAGAVVFAIDGTPHFSGMKDNITARSAEYVVAYCIDTVVQIEACVGDIEAPFGSDRWY